MEKDSKYHRRDEYRKYIRNETYSSTDYQLKLIGQIVKRNLSTIWTNVSIGLLSYAGLTDLSAHHGFKDDIIMGELVPLVGGALVMSITNLPVAKFFDYYDVKRFIRKTDEEIEKRLDREGY